MSERDGRPGRRYKVRGAGGEMEWVDHNELWRRQQEQTEQIREGRRRRLRIATLLTIGLVVLSLAALWLRRATVTGAAEPAVSTSPEPGPGSEPEPPATAPIGAPAAGEPAPAAPEREIAATVRAWADAWSRQDVTAYLGSYSPDFRPAAGSSRSRWERRRRLRVATPASIRLGLDNLEVVLLDDGRAEARFRQSYSSPDYSDVVLKTLTLAAEEDGWRIIGELAEPVLAQPMGR